MKRFLPVLLVLIVLPVQVIAEPVLDKKTVKAITQEINRAIESKDMSVFEKYLYPGSKITVDMDPAEDRGALGPPCYP